MDFLKRKKVSEQIYVNPYWACDESNPKMLINLPKLFESFLDVDSSKLFSKTKTHLMRTFMERGHTPNTLIEDISFAEDNYQVLSKMFDLKN